MELIGIISYLPNEQSLREERTELLTNLINKCKRVFPNTDIWVIAQNWKDFTIDDVTIFSYNKLGINGARQVLKDKFISSNYDHLIMLDDDCILTMDETDAKLYLQEIREYPDKAQYFVGRWLKLFSIPKELYQQIPDFGDSVDEKLINDTLKELSKNTKQVYRNFCYPYRQKRSLIINNDATSTYSRDARLKYFKQI